MRAFVPARCWWSTRTVRFVARAHPARRATRSARRRLAIFSTQLGSNPRQRSRRPGPFQRSLSAPGYVSDVQHVPHPKQTRNQNWVSDPARVLSPEHKSTINALIEDLHRATNAEFAVVCLEDITAWYPWETKLQGYGSLAESIFNGWGIGRAGINDGVLLVLYRTGRRVEVRTGSGVGHLLPSQWIVDMQQRDMLPLFREERHGEGVLRGVVAICARLQHGIVGFGDRAEAVTLSREQPSIHSIDKGAINTVLGSDAARPTGTAGGGEKAIAGFGSGVVVSRESGLHVDGTAKRLPGGGAGGGDGSKSGEYASLGTGLTVLLLLTIPLLSYQARRRRRKCKRCGRLMEVRTNRTEWSRDELHCRMTHCELEEERLGACDFELLHCSHCDLNRVGRRPRWVTKYQTCQECKCMTSFTTRHTEHIATEHSTGMRRCVEQCLFCNKRREWTETIPRKQKQSSTSRGGGGFSGGSCSGGSSGGSSWLVEDVGSVEGAWHEVLDYIEFMEDALSDRFASSSSEDPE